MLQPPAERPSGPLDRWKLPLCALMIGIGLVGGARWLASAPAGQPIALPTIAADARSVRELKVHVTGAVLQPGVYSLADGLRVADAIARAGGPTEFGDPSRLNLALRVTDGQQIVVPAVAANRPSPAALMPGVASPSTSAPGGAPGASSASGVVTRPAARARAASPTARAGKLNLNQASAAELEALPGIGRVTADRIVRHREQRGPFATLDDFKKARLISSTAFDRLKDLIEAP